MKLSLGFPETRCGGIDTTVAAFEQLQTHPDSPVRAVHRIAARAGKYADYPESMPPALRAALERQGIARLYAHQADAFRLIEQGANVVVVTPTASGKTLCYNLPIFTRLLEDRHARAMYLFPTKALAQDQLHEIQSTVDALDGVICAFTYDGDTPQDARKPIRERANLILTNPDMLHSGILPHHTRWAKCFENLRFCVIDEMHYYRGVYGSHLANVLRRLKRICAFYGSAPQFICCSATIANPRELAQALVESEFTVVDSNGAPSGERYFVFYNPPVVNRQLGIRRSYLHETRRVALDLIGRGQQTLVFANSRLATEVLVTYLKDACERGPLPAEMVRGYRGGYLPRERREIERKLREGEIRGVVATNALELGIDIGSLDAVVLAGYPGTIASTMQRAGRAGRRQSTSIAVLVASSNPVDQYIVEHPEYFFGSSPEHANINADNLEIVLGHLKCAAFELPVTDIEKFGPHDTAELCRFLEELGVLYHSGEAWHWTSDTYPADAISLRSVSSDNFVVIEITGERQAIAEVSFPTALTTLHEKAIYLHEARQYQVERFDYDGRKAYVRRVDCDYFTDAIDYTQVKILEEFERAPLAGAAVAQGDVRINRQVVGFKKIKFYTLENVGAGHLSMPEQEMHTTAFWLHFPQALLAGFADLTPAEKQNGLTGVANLLRTVAALLLMCDPRDLGIAFTEDIARNGAGFSPNLYLYDNYPGGVGQSAPLFRLAPRLVVGASELLAGCGCESGCPSCVGPAGEIGDRGKEVASRILAALRQE
jgi:DEAD/DEAH box helicase domain-containing protein